MSQHGQVARLQGSPAGAEPSLAELLDPVALEARLVEARARRLEAIARRKAAAESGPTDSEELPTPARAAATPGRPVPILPEDADPAPEADPSPMTGRSDATSTSPEIRRAPQDDAAVALPLRRPGAEPALRGGPERPAPPRVARAQAAQPAGIRAVPRTEPRQQPPARLPLPAPPPRIGPTDARTSPGRPADQRPVQPLHAPARAVPAQSPSHATAPAAGAGRSALMLGATFAAGMAGAVAALIFGPPVMRSWMTEQSAPASPAATAPAPAAAPGVETASIRAPDPVAANRAGVTSEPSSATATGDVPAGPLARTAGAPAAGDAVPLGPVLPRAVTGTSPLAPALPAAGQAPENPHCPRDGGPAGGAGPAPRRSLYRGDPAGFVDGAFRTGAAPGAELRSCSRAARRHRPRQPPVARRARRGGGVLRGHARRGGDGAAAHDRGGDPGSGPADRGTGRAGPDAAAIATASRRSGRRRRIRRPDRP